MSVPSSVCARRLPRASRRWCFVLSAIVAVAGCGPSTDQRPAAAPPSPAAAPGAPPGAPPAIVDGDAKVQGDAKAPLAEAKTPIVEPKNTLAEAKIPVAEAPRPLTDAELADGWIALFDGATLFGWTPSTQANWAVKDGVIEVSEGEKGLLCTTTSFADYVLKVDFRFAPKTNSGIFLHTPAKPTDPSKDCYELNIAEPSITPFPTGSFVKRLKSEATAAPDQWHSYEITLQGGRCLVKLNGQTALEYDDPAPLRRGLIGLQLNEGKVEFKNIKLKPLGLAPLFNGKDLAGWKQYPEMKSKFTVTPEGLLNVKDGRGQLESEGRFGDFAVQLECISHAKHLNSGLFFRCIPGQDLNGYESQIHNGFKDGDRTRPIDCGTGGIFRRRDARLVAADDLEWFSKTIVADGPHVSVWVNGYQVTDWTDTRAPDANPRKGLRTEAGTLMIQGHDPTTDLSFRNLRAAEMAPRAE